MTTLLCLSVVLLLGYLPYQGWCLECYVCNSDNDPRCGDPFTNYTIGKLDCSLKIPPEHLSPEDQESRICRKSIQTIQGKTRVIRSCGYLTDAMRDDKQCLRRSGTHEVTIYYCSCTTDLCNTAPLPSNGLLLPIATTLLTLLYKL